MGIRILVCEDSADIRIQLLALFKYEGHVAQGAENGLQGLALYSFAIDNGVPFDLVTLDGAMPKLDGWEAGRRIRSLDESLARTPVKIAFYSAHSELYEQGHLLQEVAPDLYMEKPGEPEKILIDWIKAGMPKTDPKGPHK